MVYCTVYCSLKFIVYSRKRQVEYSMVYCTVHCSLKFIQYNLYMVVDSAIWFIVLYIVV
jgi:hypothetical protein